MKLIENKKKLGKLLTHVLCSLSKLGWHMTIFNFSLTDKIAAFSFILEKIQILGMISAQIKKSKFQKMLVFQNNT